MAAKSRACLSSVSVMEGKNSTLSKLIKAHRGGVLPLVYFRDAQQFLVDVIEDFFANCTYLLF